MPCQHKTGAQAKAYTGKVTAWSGETGDESYRRRGKEAKAKRSIAQHEVLHDTKCLVIVANTHNLTSILTDPCLAQRADCHLSLLLDTDQTTSVESIGTTGYKVK